MSILEKINGHADLVDLDDAQREELCVEIREFLVEHISKTGGHLASNLGIVELTVALETVFNTEEDRLVFDVGHQSYVHKLLTGRQADFSSLRQFGGIAGFPKPSESDADAFVAGHASSSVSIALGMARARTLLGQTYRIVALLGDGAATGGMVYEGLNDAAVSGEKMMIILNDNEMSIDRNVGGLAKHLSRLRNNVSYLGMKQRYRSLLRRFPGGRGIYRITRNIKNRIKRALLGTTIFENMGLTYLGPIDGHDVNGLIPLLNAAKDLDGAVLLHVITQKGRGFAPAEENPSQFHGIGRFDPKTGATGKKSAKTFSESFGEELCALAEKDNRVCAITAAMPGGTGLLAFQNCYPDRLFDVGIAEEHAVSMAGGLAKQGMLPVVALYSTFLQRSYDMILQDIAMLHLPVILAIDRAGLVGEDGETHHGVFDVGFLRQAPGMRILSPASIAEQKAMLHWAVEENSGPVAIRYPRGCDRTYVQSAWDASTPFCWHRQGNDVALVTYGVLLENVMLAAELLQNVGIDAGVMRLLEISPITSNSIRELVGQKKIVIAEEICTGSGIREALAWELARVSPESQVYGIDLGAQFVPHGNLEDLYRHCGLDPDGIKNFVMEVVRHEDKKTTGCFAD